MLVFPSRSELSKKQRESERAPTTSIFFQPVARQSTEFAKWTCGDSSTKQRMGGLARINDCASTTVLVFNATSRLWNAVMAQKAANY